MPELLEIDVAPPLTVERLFDLQIRLKIAHLAEFAMHTSQKGAECALTEDDYASARAESAILEAELDARNIPLYDEVYMRRRGNELEKKSKHRMSLPYSPREFRKKPTRWQKK